MTFIGNKLIPAAFFAAVASIAIANPAQALKLSGGFDFDGFLTDIAVTDEDNFTIDFNEAHDDSALIGQCSGSFETPVCTGSDTYRVNISDSLAVSGGVLTVNTNPFLSGISTDQGFVDFRLDDVDVFSAFSNGAVDATGFLLTGAFYDDSGEFAGKGVFTANQIGEDGSFSGSLATAVPTPAAVLPILTGLFGAASRKKQEEEEA